MGDDCVDFSMSFHVLRTKLLLCYVVVLVVVPLSNLTYHTGNKELVKKERFQP